MRYLFAIFITLSSVDYVWAQPFRERGDESIEAAVMESQAIIDVVQSSLQGGEIVNVLYGNEVIGREIAKGMHIEMPEFPVLEVSTYATPAVDSQRIKDPLPTAYYDAQIARMLMFRQRSVAEGVEHFGYELDSKSKLRNQNNSFQPRIRLGDKSWIWLSFKDRETKEWSDEKWQTSGYVEDLSVERAASYRAFAELYRQFQPPERMTQEHARYYPLGDDLKKWGDLLDRVQHAVAVRVQFDSVTDFVPRNEQINFYLSMIKDEHIYANYALQGIARIGDREIANVLTALMTRLKFFVDDVWQTALEITLPKPIPNAAERALGRLNGFIEVFEKFSDAECGSRDSMKKAIAVALKGSADAFNDPLLGYAEEKPLISSLQRLYAAELKCFVIGHKLKIPDLLPQEQDPHSFLTQPENSGLTLDEIGLTGNVSRLRAEDYRKKQVALNDFTPELTEIAISSSIVSPVGLQKLLNYAANGVAHYSETALPDLTRGSYGVWKRTFAIFDRFEWPQDYCDAPDSRTIQYVSDYSVLFAKAIEVAIVNEDEELLRSSFKAFTQDASYEKAALLAQIVPRTFEYRDRPMRRAFIELLGKLPYYPVARALAEEYSKTGMTELKDLEKILQQMTGQESEGKGSAKGWIIYLTELEEKRKGHLDKPLYAKSALVDSLSRPPCARAEYGWNRLFKNQKLPQQ